MVSTGSNNSFLMILPYPSSLYSSRACCRPPKIFDFFSPCAFKKVYAIPPPMIKVSHFSNKLEITFNLSATFAPPKMATNGLTGFSTAFPKSRSLFALSIRQLRCPLTRQLLRSSSVLCALYRMHRLQTRHRGTLSLWKMPRRFCVLRAVTGVL